MKEINCNIIRDILPLFVDEVVSEDTKELVSEHLEGCPGCRQELEQLRKPVAIPVERETGPLKRFKKKWKQARFRTALISIFCTVVILAALAAGALWYTRPMTLEELCPGFDLAQCQVMNGIYSICVNGDIDDNTFHLNEGDSDFDQLLEKIRGHTFRRSLRNLVPDILYDNLFNHDWVIVDEDDFGWTLALWYPDMMPVISNFYGNVHIRYSGNTVYCSSTSDQEQWLSDVMDIIKAHKVEY